MVFQALAAPLPAFVLAFANGRAFGAEGAGGRLTPGLLRPPFSQSATIQKQPS